MLPILVLALAASALAAPGVQNVRLISSNEIGASNLSPSELIFELIDGGDKYLSGVNLGAVLKDMYNQGNQAQANGQSLATFSELATGIPGDACAAANYVNAYTNYVRTGNAAGVREALAGFFQALSAKIDNLTALATNKDAVRYSSGVRGNCPAGGRNYQFDNAWDIILGSSNNPLGIVQEEYCVAKRLYCAFPARLSNVGAALTAAALPPSTQIFIEASQPIANFMAAAGTKTNVGAAAASLKQALANAVANAQLA